MSHVMEDMTLGCPTLFLVGHPTLYRWAQKISRDIPLAHFSGRTPGTCPGEKSHFRLISPLLSMLVGDS
jgi:hypothetical protein